MKYVSIFSGIEAATVAWQPLGWEPLAFSDFDAVPVNRIAASLPGYPESRGYYENRLEPI